MDFRFTKFSTTNSLISLIPIFPCWTVFPIILVSMGLGELFKNCELGYKFAFGGFVIALVASIAIYFRRLGNIVESRSIKELKSNFRLFSLLIYTLLNSVIIILIIGFDLACHGDGQIILAFIFSGPIASVGLLILGFTIDLCFQEKITFHNN